MEFCFSGTFTAVPLLLWELSSLKGPLETVKKQEAAATNSTHCHHNYFSSTEVGEKVAKAVVCGFTHLMEHPTASAYTQGMQEGQYQTSSHFQKNWVERELGRGIGMGNTCKSMADSCLSMTKTTTIL